MMQSQLQSGGVRRSHLSPPPHLSSSLRRSSCKCFIPRKKPRHSSSHSLLSLPPIPWIPPAINAVALVAAAVVLSTPPPSEETLSNVPQLLSGEPCDSSSKDCQDGGKRRIQRPKSRNAESCTIKCVTTCIRGGDGSPGEGPLNVRRPIVVFKQGFRTRNYCLVECSEICNLLDKAEKGR